MKTLREVKVGGRAKVVKLHGEGAVRRRIMDMGITKGVEIYVRKVAPLGGTVCLDFMNLSKKAFFFKVTDQLFGKMVQFVFLIFLHF